jgi:hypothetical protein
MTNTVHKKTVALEPVIIRNAGAAVTGPKPSGVTFYVVQRTVAIQKPLGLVTTYTGPRDAIAVD